MHKLVRSKSDTNFFADKQDLDNIHLNLRAIKSSSKSNKECLLSRKTSKIIDTNSKVIFYNIELKSLPSLRELYNSKKSSSSIKFSDLGTIPNAEKAEENFYKYLKTILLLKRKVDNEIFQSHIEGTKLYINILLEIMRVILLNFKTRYLLKSVNESPLILTDNNLSVSPNSREGLIESVEKFDRILDIIIKIPPEELIREVKSLILNEFEQTKIEISENLEKYKKDSSSSKLFISISQTILFILSQVSYKLDFYSLTANSLTEKLKRICIDYVENSCEQRDDNRITSNMKRTVFKGLHIVEKFIKLKKVFAKDFYGNLSSQHGMENKPCSFNKFSSFGRYFFNNLPQLFGDEMIPIKSKSEINFKWPGERKKLEKTTWKSYFNKVSSNQISAKLDKFFRLYFNSRLVGWNYYALDTETSAKKSEICRICENSISINDYILHIYYCRDQKVFYNTLIDIQNCMTVCIEELKNYREKMNSGKKGVRDQIFSPKSSLCRKWCKFGAFEKTPVMFPGRVSTFNKDRTSLNQTDGLIDFLISTLSKENKLIFEFYEENPQKLSQLIALLHFITYLYIYNKHSDQYSEDLNGIFANLFSCLMKKVIAIEDILTLLESKNKSNIKTNNVIFKETSDKQASSDLPQNNSKDDELIPSTPMFMTKLRDNPKAHTVKLSIDIFTAAKTTAKGLVDETPKQVVSRQFEFGKILEEAKLFLNNKTSLKVIPTGTSSTLRNSNSSSKSPRGSFPAMKAIKTIIGGPKNNPTTTIPLPNQNVSNFSPRLSSVKEISKGLKKIVTFSEEPRVDHNPFTVTHRESCEFKDTISNKNTNTNSNVNDFNSTPQQGAKNIISCIENDNDNQISPSLSPMLNPNLSSKTKINSFHASNKKSLFGNNLSPQLCVCEDEQSFEGEINNEEESNFQVDEEIEADSQLGELDDLFTELFVEENENSSNMQNPYSSQHSNNNVNVIMDIINDTVNESDSSNSSKYSVNRLNFVSKVNKPNPIKIEDFQFIKMLGQGAYGRVDVYRKIKTGDLYAIKSVNINKMKDKNITGLLANEALILNETSSEYIVKCYYIFSDESYYYYVMEYMVGGDLLGLLNSIVLSEKTIQLIVAQIILALEYLHSTGIIHRDLKPENIVISKEGRFKLTDFGISESGLKTNKYAIFQPDNKYSDLDLSVCLDKQLGTGNYMAPEIFKDEIITTAVDFWALGVLIYELYTFKVPFSGESPEKIKENVINFYINWSHFESDELKEMYPKHKEARDLIEHLLVIDPKQRWGDETLDKIKKHPFFKGFNWAMIKDNLDGDVLHHVKALSDKINGEMKSKAKDQSKSVENSEQSRKSENENDKTIEMDARINIARVDSLYFKCQEVIKTKIKRRELKMNTESNHFTNFFEL